MLPRENDSLLLNTFLGLYRDIGETAKLEQYHQAWKTEIFIA